jgi:uncharacterized repeat protein (TIGR03803 family)
VFSVNPATGAETVVYSFQGGSDGYYPAGELIDVNGTLYGTTNSGGIYNLGTVFSVDAKTGGETVMHSFGNGSDGGNPLSGLINVKGTLYGTTQVGGTHDSGSVYSINTTTGAETVLYSFQGGTDGLWPNTSFIDVKGTLYGTTSLGGGTGCQGGEGCGTVFSFNVRTSAETVVYSFQGGTDGGQPADGSLINVKGTLYGTTVFGGGGGGTACNEFGCGTVFSITP